MVFAGDIYQRQMDVEHGGFDVGVSHEGFQDRYLYALPGHIGTEGVTKTMRIGRLESGASSARAEEASKSFDGHGMTAAVSLEHDKEMGRGAEGGSLETEIAQDDIFEDVGQRQHALFVSFAQNTQPAFVEEDIARAKGQDLLGAKAAKQHEIDHRHIAIAP